MNINKEIDLDIGDVKFIATKCVEDAIKNIKNRNLMKEKGSKTYNIANWTDDWNWIYDDESNFEEICIHAELNPDQIKNEVMRLAKVRVEDGVFGSTEWIESKLVK